MASLIAYAASDSEADDCKVGSHALLAALHIDLIEDMLAEGLSLATIRSAQPAHTKAVFEAMRGG